MALLISARSTTGSTIRLGYLSVTAMSSGFSLLLKSTKGPSQPGVLPNRDTKDTRINNLVTIPEALPFELETFQARKLPIRNDANISRHQPGVPNHAFRIVGLRIRGQQTVLIRRVLEMQPVCLL